MKSAITLATFTLAVTALTYLLFSFIAMDLFWVTGTTEISYLARFVLLVAAFVGLLLGNDCVLNSRRTR